MLVLNCGSDVREVQIDYSLPAENSAGHPCNERISPSWVASLEDVLLREEHFRVLSMSSSLYDQPIDALP
ncbi:unnamed protein product [Strongylus vulgaris]|uniref:Uncharacterized protein n=1 Tax=Strongylus vulgaris TaxID=40348 RepID=A0A3P7JUZ2_STRVU|nr:unnamed protein product [Strongylus vulgaris]